jgi:hypothetical protein
MISLTQVVEEMKVFALAHKMQAGDIADDGCMRNYEWDNKTELAFVLTRDMIPEMGKEIWHLSMSHRDPKIMADLPPDIVNQAVLTFFGANAKVLELPRISFHPYQRQFVAIE